jgi:hypothetical protein
MAAERMRLAAAPLQYGATVAPLRVARAIDAARGALAANDLFAAGRHVDRGLAIAPEDPTLRGLLDRMLGASSSLAPAAAPAPDDAAATTVDLRTAEVAAPPRAVRRLQIGIALAFAAAIIAGVVIGVTRSKPAVPAATATPPTPAPTATAAPTEDDELKAVYDPDKIPDKHEISRPAHVAPSTGSAVPPPVVEGPAAAPAAAVMPAPSGTEVTRPASVLPSRPAPAP